MLPGLFRRLPAITSVGYLMPRDRYFFAGVSFSAALHAAVLFGFNAPVKPPVRPIGLTPVPPLVVFELPLDEPEKPVAKADEAKTDDKTDTASSGETAARLPEPMGNPLDSGGLAIPIERVAMKMPDATSTTWKVPDKIGGGGIDTRKIKVFRKEDLDDIPVATSRPAPRYPFEMKRIGATGTALLRFVVDSHGEVTDVEIVSADYPEFGKAAAEAMLKWKFKAGRKDGRRVNTRMEMPMAFSLERST
jgi:protein TonB